MKKNNIIKNILYVFIGLIIGYSLAFIINLNHVNNITISTQQSPNVVHKTNYINWENTPLSNQKKITYSIYAYYPDLLLKSLTEPSIWETVNNFSEKEYNVQLPRPTYQPLIGSQKAIYNPIGVFLVKHKKNIEEYVQNLNINAIQKYWNQSNVPTTKQGKIKLWETLILKNAKKRYTSEIFLKFKKDFMNS